MRNSVRVPKQMQPTFDSLVTLTDQFCQECLNDEYAELAREAAATLCRKRPSPLVNGRTNSWACGIVHALGRVNFLTDKSQEPYISAADLFEGFGVSSATGFARSKAVREALGIRVFDPNWCLPSKLDDNPMAWLVSVDGLMVDVRWMPREVQEIAYEKGLIPYLPD